MLAEKSKWQADLIMDSIARATDNGTSDYSEDPVVYHSARKAMLEALDSVRGPDFNSDQCVNLYDLGVFARHWLTQGQNLDGDFDLSQDVDLADFIVLPSKFGTSMESWSDGNFDGDGTVDFADFIALSRNFGFRRG